MSGTAFLRGGCRSFVSRRKTLSDVIGSETVVTQTVRRYRRLPQLVRRFRDSIDTSPRAFSASAAKRKEGGGCGGLVAWYLGMVKRQPVLTKSVTCSLIYTAADLSSQTIARTVSDEPPPYDLFRTLRMASYGMVLLGPTLHMWFGLMSSLCPKQDLVSTFKKMAMGQAIYGRIMTIVFFSFNAAAQGENSAEITARLKRDLVPALFNGVMYWPVCDFITFRFTPLHLQVCYNVNQFERASC
uniref:PXMP2/4 family protein 4 n=1 Tax=Kalanchoe fedtschenkoi TaxID=63787 RepID=A0A7N0TVN1_KALFE